MDGDFHQRKTSALRKRWSSREDRQLLELAGMMTTERVAGVLGRTRSTVERRLAILRRRANLFSRPAWTAEELATLAACESVEQAIAVLSKTRAEGAIRQRYRRMKDEESQPERKGWSADDDDILRGQWAVKTRHELAAMLGRSPSAVSYRAWFLGLSGRSAKG